MSRGRLISSVLNAPQSQTHTYTTLTAFYHVVVRRHVGHPFIKMLIEVADIYIVRTTQCAAVYAQVVYGQEHSVLYTVNICAKRIKC